MNALIIGAGDIAQTFYAPSLLKLKKQGVIDNVFVSDVKKQNEAYFKLNFSFSPFEKKDMDYVDAIFVTVPYEKIGEVTQYYATFHKPMMLEKPPATDVETAYEMLDTLNKHSIKHQVAFNRHYMPMTTKLRSELKARKLRIDGIQTIMNRYRRKENTFYSTAIHDIDLVKFLSPSLIENVEFLFSKKNNDCIITYEMQDGSIASSIFQTNSGMIRETVSVTCQDHTLISSLPMYETVDRTGIFSIFKDNKEVISEKGDDLPPFMLNGIYQEIESFLTDVENNTDPYESMQYALDSIRIMEAMKKKERRVKL